MHNVNLLYELYYCMKVYIYILLLHVELQKPRKMVCFRYIIVNTLHKVDIKDIIIIIIIIIIIMRFSVTRDLVITPVSRYGRIDWTRFLYRNVYSVG